MGKILTTLGIALLAACNTATGLLERDLDSLKVSLFQDRPAGVSGVLHPGLSLESFARAAAASGVSDLTIGVAESDREDLCRSLEAIQGMLAAAALPPTMAERHVEASQKGLYWSPEYRWELSRDSLVLIAHVTIANLTGRVWTTLLDICDADGERLGGSVGAMTIQTGSSSLFWWRTSTPDAGIVLTFGWPVPGRWNALLALPIPVGRRVPDGSGATIFLRADTIWRAADDLLDLEQETVPAGRGYSGTLTMTSLAEWPLGISFRPPDKSLPGGAVLEARQLPDSLVLQPGECRRVGFALRYPG